METIRRLFSEDGFTPHGFCLIWDPMVLWLNAASDILIGLAYYSIPVALCWILVRRRDVEFGWMFALFAIFILACGTTHFMDVLTLWYPLYGVQGLIKATTAVASVVTATCLWPLVPRLLALPSPAQLRDANALLGRQVAERDAALERASAAEARYRLLVERVVDYSICRLDPAGVVVTWNRGAERIAGYRASDILGQHYAIFFTPAARDAGEPVRALEIAARDGTFETEVELLRRDGRRYWAHLVIDALRDDQETLVGFAKITRDVSERRAAAEELERTRAMLAQAQRLNAVGQLAGGMAHDLNNFLTSVIGNLELVQRQGALKPVDAARLGAATKGAEAGAALISKVLSFSRRQMLSPVAVDLNRVVAGTLGMLGSALGERIRLETLLVDGLWQTHADPSLVETTLLNLALNARDAMPEGGTLTIETGNVVLDESYAEAHETAPGAYACLTVADTGEGMDAATLARAFEPFFTTKGVGKGSGLGLSQVYGFVRQSGGHVTLYSERGAGTVARIYLPRFETAPVAGEGPGATAPAAGERNYPHGSELVLVVEDNDEVRGLSRDALQSLGYRVLEAAQPSAALALLDARPEIDLLFTDVVLPEMNGHELAAEALRRNPDLRIVYTSGYTESAILQQGRLERGQHFVAKPFRLDDLARKLRAALGG